MHLAWAKTVIALQLFLLRNSVQISSDAILKSDNIFQLDLVHIFGLGQSRLKVLSHQIWHSTVHHMARYGAAVTSTLEFSICIALHCDTMLAP